MAARSLCMARQMGLYRFFSNCRLVSAPKKSLIVADIIIIIAYQFLNFRFKCSLIAPFFKLDLYSKATNRCIRFFKLKWCSRIPHMLKVNLVCFFVPLKCNLNATSVMNPVENIHIQLVFSLKLILKTQIVNQLKKYLLFCK